MRRLNAPFSVAYVVVNGARGLSAHTAMIREANHHISMEDDTFFSYVRTGLPMTEPAKQGLMCLAQ